MAAALLNYNENQRPLSRSQRCANTCTETGGELHTQTQTQHARLLHPPQGKRSSCCCCCRRHNRTTRFVNRKKCRHANDNHETRPGCHQSASRMDGAYAHTAASVLCVLTLPHTQAALSTNQHQSAVWMGRMRTPLLQFCACLHCHTCRQAQQQDQPRCSPKHRNLAASYHNASGRVPAGTPSLRVSRCAAANTTYNTKPLQDSRLHASSFPVQYLLPKQAARSSSTCLSFPTIACNVHSSASRCSNPPLILLLHPRC